jgi:hypothetical protein
MTFLTQSPPNSPHVQNHLAQDPAWTRGDARGWVASTPGDILA